MKPIKVLSLFDGMACGYQALKQASIPLAEYHSFEIDKYAIKIANKNHPNIIQHGDVKNFDFSIFNDFDLVIGGSPCQGFSYAGKQLAFDDPRSELFFEFVRCIKEVKPKYFLLENVKMKKEWLKVITEQLGVEPILINSALVSAQNRERYYWCNWKVDQPKDKKLFLSDIVEQGVVDRDKSYCVDANYWKGTTLLSYFEKHRRQLVFGKILQTSERGRKLTLDGSKRDDKKGILIRGYEVRPDGKTCTLTTVQKDNYITEDYVIRKLTPIECERLQTLPDNYTEGVSNTQRYKMLGNGWTVSVIQHLLEELEFKEWKKENHPWIN